MTELKANKARIRSNWPKEEGEIKRRLPEDVEKARAALRNERMVADMRGRRGRQLWKEKDIKLIRGCLHPDRAPEGQEAKFQRAFTVFTEKL